MKTKTQLFLSTLIAASFVNNVQLPAAPLNLTAGPPDFIASSLFVNFVYGSNSFSAEGLTTGYQGGSVPLVGSGSYSLTAYINTYLNPSGYVGFGSLTIKGDIGAGPQTLLTGTLNTGPSGTAFGFQDPPGGDIFEFLFTVTGGDPVIVSDFGGLGSGNHGVIVNAFFENGGTPFNGTWNRGFRNDGHSGVSDTFAEVPEPGAMVLFLVGSGMWIARNRSQLKKTAQHRYRTLVRAKMDHVHLPKRPQFQSSFFLSSLVTWVNSPVHEPLPQRGLFSQALELDQARAHVSGCRWQRLSRGSTCEWSKQ